MLFRCFDVVLGFVPIKHRRHLHTANMQRNCMHTYNIYLVIDNTIHTYIQIHISSEPASWATVAAAATCKNQNNERKLNVINMKVHTRNYKLPLFTSLQEWPTRVALPVRRCYPLSRRLNATAAFDFYNFN